VDGSIQAEPALETRLRVPRAQVEAEMQEVVGRAARPLARGKPEGLLGNLLTDVMRAHASEVTGKPVDVAFVNLGGLRADLPAGDLTRGALLEVMPFDNTLVVMEVKGTDLQAVFDRAALHDGDPVSGARYVVRARTAVEVTVGDAPLDPARTYRLCTSDYIADGGGRYESLKRATRVNRTGILIRDILLGHVERETAAGRPVDARITGRVRVSNAAPTPPPAAEATP
jgi:2',3'-cyclic-nucleotide 2'-phosphodiesterase (5'-nucleotidase family)